MIAVEWAAIVPGVVVGVVMTALYFAGLAVSVRYALKTDSPVRILSLSAALRIAALLSVGWAVMAQAGPWAVLGYAFVFLFGRIIITTFARVTATPERAP